jgi:hypothetical protein
LISINQQSERKAAAFCPLWVITGHEAGWPGCGPQWLEIVARDLTSLGSPTVLALITIAASAIFGSTASVP